VVAAPLQLGQAALAELSRKYRVMSELRALGAPDGAPEERRALRQLAEEFPGALRELDTLASSELASRSAELAAALAGAPAQEWMVWMDGYHRLMRAALEVKRRIATGAGPPSAPRLAELERACGVPLDDRFVAEVSNPPHGRLMVTVFSRLSARFGVPQKQLWDRLFPPRKGERPYRGR
jgi:hypothetical protein